MKPGPRIVMVSAVYPPEPVVSAQNGRDLAMHLAKRGMTFMIPGFRWSRRRLPSAPMLGSVPGRSWGWVS